MARRQSASLDRKKFFGDPVMVVTIIVLIVLLLLFIVYPLAILLVDSVLVRGTQLYSVSTLAEGDIAFCDAGGGTVTDPSGKLYVRLEAAEEGGEPAFVPLYSGPGLFPRRAKLRDAEGPLYLKVSTPRTAPPTWTSATSPRWPRPP